MRSLLLTFCLILATLGFGQSLTPTVIGTTGDFFVGSSATLSWTLGEIMTETYNGTSNQLTQGFHQPTRSDVGIEESDDLQISIYPNPARDQVIIELADNTEELNITLYSISGEIVYYGVYSGNSPFPIDLSGFADGMYLLQITNSDQEILETTKIQKTK